MNEDMQNYEFGEVEVSISAIGQETKVLHGKLNLRLIISFGRY